MTKSPEAKQRSSRAVKIILLIVAGLILPVILLPLIKLVGYAEVIEEAAKALVVLFLILKLPAWKTQILGGVAFAFLFGFSESVLYLNNIFQLGDFDIFLRRFMGAVPMHIATVLIILFLALKNKKLMPLAIFLTILIHLFFNNFLIT